MKCRLLLASLPLWRWSGPLSATWIAVWASVFWVFSASMVSLNSANSDSFNREKRGRTGGAVFYFISEVNTETVLLRKCNLCSLNKTDVTSLKISGQARLFLERMRNYKLLDSSENRFLWNRRDKTIGGGDIFLGNTGVSEQICPKASTTCFE